MIRPRSLLILTVLVGAGCGSNTDSDAEADRAANASVATPAVSSSTPASDAPVAETPEVLRFRAPLVGGGEIDMSTLAGQPVVLWFWAPY